MSLFPNLPGNFGDASAFASAAAAAAKLAVSNPAIPPIKGVPDTVYNEDEQAKGRYLIWGCNVQVIYNAGLLQIPVAVDPSTALNATDAEKKPPCSIVRTAAAWGKKIITYRARRLGIVPDFPTPATDNPNETLEAAAVDVDGMFPDVGGVLREYAGGAVYVFILSQPLTAWEQGVSIPNPPFLQTPDEEEDMAILPDNFVDGILGDDPENGSDVVG